MISIARIYVESRAGFEIPAEHEPGANLVFRIRSDYAPGTAGELAFATLREAGLKMVGQTKIFIDPK